MTFKQLILIRRMVYPLNKTIRRIIMNLKRNLLLILFAFIFTVFVSSIPDIVLPSYWQSLVGTQLRFAIVGTILLFVIAIVSMVIAVKELRKINKNEQDKIKKDNEERDQILIENLKSAFREVLREDREARSK